MFQFAASPLGVFFFIEEIGEGRKGEVLSETKRLFPPYLLSHTMKYSLLLLSLSAATLTAAPQNPVSLFNGKDLTGWTGTGYVVKDGVITCTPKGRNLTTVKQYTNYSFEFEFKLPPGGNNGLGIHYPGAGNPAYTGMEVQILDNTAEKYAKLKEYQFHGGLYTLKAAKKGHLKPVGEWNKEKVTVNGSNVTVELNGTVINSANLDEIQKKYPKHTGVKRRSGHLCFCGHGDPVQFRGMKITELAGAVPAVGAQKLPATPPKGFASLFNGKDLTGWFGHATKDPRTLWEMSSEELEAHKKETRKDINKHWSAENGELVNDGQGLYLTTNKDYGNFELMLEYKTVAKADSGIYLRGVPQVQIWDTTKEGGKWKLGADKGSCGLWNNSKGAPGKNPSKNMDKPFGEWNSVHILMVGNKVTIHFNGEKVVDAAVMENFFDRKNPIFERGPIQLQTHGGEIRWRNVFIKEL